MSTHLKSILDLPKRYRALAQAQIDAQTRQAKPSLAQTETVPRPAVRSGLEMQMLPLIAQAGMDMALLEQEACLIEGRDFRCDFVYRPLRIVIEVEGVVHGAKAAVGAHQGVEQVGRDCLKYDLLQIGGWMVLRFTGRQIRHSGDMVIATIKAAMEVTRAGM